MDCSQPDSSVRGILEASCKSPGFPQDYYPSGLLGATAEARGPGDVEGSAWGMCEGWWG